MLRHSRKQSNEPLVDIMLTSQPKTGPRGPYRVALRLTAIEDKTCLLVLKRSTNGFLKAPKAAESVISTQKGHAQRSSDSRIGMILDQTDIVEQPVETENLRFFGHWKSRVLELKGQRRNCQKFRAKGQGYDFGQSEHQCADTFTSAKVKNFFSITEQ